MPATRDPTFTESPATIHFAKLCEIVARLRAPDGCPWDREQTHQSLVPGLLEEAYEVADAIRTNDDANLREELGDLLLQVVMHAQIASEEGRFTIDDVAAEIGGQTGPATSARLRGKRGARHRRRAEAVGRDQARGKEIRTTSRISAA